MSFDLATKTVSLDGKAILVDHSTVFHAFLFIARAEGQFVLTKDIQDGVKGFRGRPDVLFARHLPDSLRDCLKSKNGHGGGYSILLPVRTPRSRKKSVRRHAQILRRCSQ